MKKVALIGCAHIHTPGFVKRLLARDDVKTVAVWDPDPARSRKRAEELGAPVIETPDAVWADDGIEGVIICSETDLHEELVLAAAQAGKHMFVEKPLGLGAADANRMAAAIEAAGVLFLTGYFQRGLPAHQFLKQQIQQGTFGQITRVRFSNCHGGSLGDWFTPEWLWMTDPKRAGVGAYGDLGTHALDLMLWMLGEVEQVTATLRVVTGRYGPACDETGEGLLRFRNGVIGGLAAGWVDVADPITCLVSGTEGHAYVCNRREVFIKSEHLPGADGQSPWTDLPEAWPHAFDLFLDALNGKDVPLVGAREAAYRSVVMEALYRAAAQNAWVEVG
ncbi:MAG: gfo/Idh/MocA family oxidoreductase [Caldilineae bacterium]|nr:MAG: gfo/Idh/MocA family oxidoreductase [Caldilineae bacterium]